MERLTMASFVANGHEFHLYCYEEPEGDLPEGVMIRDARDVLPPSWQCRDSRGSLSGFANLFRYKLLYDRGGWWVDMDIVCVSPFDFADEYVFALEPDQTIGNDVIRVPPGSDMMQYAWDRSRRYGPRPWPLPRKRMPWGAVGPSLFADAVRACDGSAHAVAPEVFNPIDWPDWEMVLRAHPPVRLDDQTKAVHLWNAMWGLAGRDKNASYDSDCLYERLKRRYLSAEGD
jgi:Alpha 1,4-glycosyltransferase conserved region